MSDRLFNPPAGTELSKYLMDLPPEQQTPYFKILLDQAINPDQLATTYQPGSVSFPVDVRSSIDQSWQRVLDRNPNAFPGPMVRLNRLGFRADGSLLFELNDTNYAEYTGTKFLTETQRLSVGFELAHPLCAALIVRSEEALRGFGGILFAQRASDLAHRPNALEFPAGNITPKHLNKDGSIDPVVAAITELGEEQAIKPEELENIKVLGTIYEQHQDAAPVVIVSAELNADPHEVLRRQGDGEAIRSFWVRDEDEMIAQMLLQQSAMSLPLVGAAYYLDLKRHDPALAIDYLDLLRERQVFESSLTSDQLRDLELLNLREFARFGIA